MSHWSLSSIQLKLIKIGARIVSHCRMTVFQMAEVAVPEKLFLLDAIENSPPGEGMREGPGLELVNAAEAIRWPKTRDNYPRTTRYHAVQGRYAGVGHQ